LRDVIVNLLEAALVMNNRRLTDTDHTATLPFCCLRAGMGPAFAATLAEPAPVPYYVHFTWPGTALCNQSTLLLRDYATAVPYGWVAAANATNGQAGGSGADKSTQQQQGAVYGSDVDTVNGSYSGSFIISYSNCSLVCPQSLTAASCPGQDPRNATGCIAAAYQRRNPDRLLDPGSAAFAAANVGRQQGSGGNYGLSVVLPAVLASVLGEKCATAQDRLC
jgi:hypothetical protein